MPDVTSQKNLISFSSGEWSPLLDSRTDQQGYDSACRELTNFKVRPYGTAERRAGTQFIAPTKFPGKKSRLIGYQFSVTTSFVLELGDLYMRFFSNGVRVESPPLTPVEIVTPWLESELFEIQYRQVNDVVYLTHPNRRTQRLKRITDINWELVDAPFDETAFLDLNVTTTTINTSVLTGSGTLGSSAPLFDVLHVGSFWKLTHPRVATALILDLAAAGTSATLPTQGTWTLRTKGTWDGLLELQQLNPTTSNWDNLRSLNSTGGDSNFDIEDIQVDEADFRLDFTHGSGGAGTAYLELTDTTRSGIVEVTGFNNSQSVNITVIKDLESTDDTDVWREGAWSDFQGYPRVVEIFEQRLILAGTRLRPQTIWGSASGDLENFTSGTNDDQSFQYTIASKEQNIIQWIEGQIQLLIGTAGAEWAMSGTGDSPITPTNVSVLKQSTNGSRHIQGIMVGDTVLFVQRNGRKVREIVESETTITAKYIANDLTILAEHITEGEIIQTDYAQQPDNGYYAVTGNGEIALATIEKAQDVTGWTHYNSPGADGFIESVAIVYGATQDEVWLSIRRNISGSDIRYIERMNPFEWIEKEDAYFVDCGITTVLPTHSSGSLTAGKSYRVIDNAGGMDMTAVGGPAAPDIFETFDATITAVPNYGTGSVREVSAVWDGLDHLEGQRIQVLGDGAVYEDLLVSSGSVTLTANDKVTKAHLGLKFESFLQPMKIEADAQIGSHMSRVMQIRKAYVNLFKSLGLSIHTNLMNPDGTRKFVRHPFRDTQDKTDESPPLYTGVREIQVDARHLEDGNIVIRQDQPLPCMMRALILKYEVTGD